MDEIKANPWNEEELADRIAQQNNIPAAQARKNAELIFKMARQMATESALTFDEALTRAMASMGIRP